MNNLDIIEIRNKLGLNQEDFGKLIGVSKNTVYNYENGAKIPDSKIPILEKYLDGQIQVVNEPRAVYKTDNRKIELLIEQLKFKEEQIEFYKKQIIFLESNCNCVKKNKTA